MKRNTAKQKDHRDRKQAKVIRIISKEFRRLEEFGFKFSFDGYDMVARTKGQRWTLGFSIGYYNWEKGVHTPDLSGCGVQVIIEVEGDKPKVFFSYLGDLRHYLQGVLAKMLIDKGLA
jgi:hypothetical protein